MTHREIGHSKRTPILTDWCNDRTLFLPNRDTFFLTSYIEKTMRGTLLAEDDIIRSTYIRSNDLLL